MGNSEPLNIEPANNTIKREILISYSNKISLPLHYKESFSGTPYGLTLKDSNIILSRFIILNKDKFNGHSVFEMLSGTGLVGIVVSKHTEARSVTVSEKDSECINNLKFNVSLNKAERTKIISFNWKEFSKNEHKYGILLACDPFAQNCEAELLVQVSNHFLNEKGVLIIAAPNDEKLQKFFVELTISNNFLIHHHEVSNNSEYSRNPLSQNQEGLKRFPQLAKGQILIYEITKKNMEDGNEGILIEEEKKRSKGLSSGYEKEEEKIENKVESKIVNEEIEEIKDEGKIVDDQTKNEVQMDTNKKQEPTSELNAHKTDHPLVNEVKEVEQIEEKHEPVLVNKIDEELKFPQEQTSEKEQNEQNMEVKQPEQQEQQEQVESEKVEPIEKHKDNMNEEEARKNQEEEEYNKNDLVENRNDEENEKEHKEENEFKVDGEEQQEAQLPIQEKQEEKQNEENQKLTQELVEPQPESKETLIETPEQVLQNQTETETEKATDQPIESVETLGEKEEKEVEKEEKSSEKAIEVSEEQKKEELPSENILSETQNSETVAESECQEAVGSEKEEEENNNTEENHDENDAVTGEEKQEEGETKKEGKKKKNKKNK